MRRAERLQERVQELSFWTVGTHVNQYEETRPSILRDLRRRGTLGLAGAGDERESGAMDRLERAISVRTAGWR